jgi:trehalose 6-phosphate phosphatase
MKLIDGSLDIEGFFSSVGAAGVDERGLLLDYDGTLAPFTLERDRAYPYPGVRKALDSLMAMELCRVVIISGRAVDGLLPVLGLKKTPEVWGSHGWERLGPDGYDPPRLPEGMLEGLDELEHWGTKIGLGNRLERKPAATAVHLRGLERGEEFRLKSEAVRIMGDIASLYGLDLHEFDGGLELRPPGRHKGHAVKTLMKELGDACVLAYLGDDATDEDAFRALGQRGLGVLVRPQYRDTGARLWLTPPEELLWFIGRWTAACGGR